MSQPPWSSDPTGAPVPPGPAWDDPLVTPPDAGLNGWYERVVLSVRRSWRTAAVILGITHALPTAAFSAVATAYLGTSGDVFGFAPMTPVESAAVQDQFGDFVAIWLLAGVALALVQAVGWAAGTWALTREAAGQAAPIGQAFAYGIRRAPGLWGWSLVSWLIVLVGMCACVLPGLYFLVALALAGPVYLFERGRNPIARSFGLLHANFRPILGRLAIVIAVLVAGQTVATTVENFGLAILGATDATVLTIIGVVVAVIGVAITVPFAIVQLVGLVATYAEQVGRDYPTSTPQLLAALDGPPGQD